MEDSDLSLEENQITEIARMINLEMLEGECLEELEELRRNENPFHDHEQNNATNLIIEFDEVDNARHVGRIPCRVNEWCPLIDQNRERKSQGLEPIYPWEKHLELSSVVDVDNGISSTRVSEFARSLSHFSLEDGNLIQVHDNSLSCKRIL